MSNVNSFTTTIPSGTTISVYQTFELDRDTRWKIMTLTREKNAARLRVAFHCHLRRKGYVGSFELAEDSSLEDLYKLLQHDTHEQGWVEATGAQRDWDEKAPACSLSCFDVLTTDDGQWFIVAPNGFFQFQ